MTQPCEYAPCNNTFIDNSPKHNRKYCSEKCGQLAHYYNYMRNKKEVESDEIITRKMIKEQVIGGMVWGDEVCTLI